MIDRYTKAVLTVIAVCLCLITAQNFNFIPSAEASGYGIQKVAICAYNNPATCDNLYDNRFSEKCARYINKKFTSYQFCR